MKYLHRTLTVFLAGILILGSVGCGKTQDIERRGEVTSAEPARVTSADPALLTALDTAVEESPGSTWLVPSEGDCPAASREDAPLNMTVEDVSLTRATVVLQAKDGGEFDAGYGAAYGIERFEENGWVNVGPGCAFPEWYRMATACREYRDTVELVADGAPLKPGYYRLNKVFSSAVDGGLADITYYAYFEIGE